ncbi:MAG: hypothetical protein BMS9Abin26_1251 [Gammaproteobacteria bacterium]|nr:MAG: hypothetical protein BMS9Abin26_1251 [Gammaproteobacteria bacterium]
MTRSQRLKPILNLAENREKDAARKLGEWRQQLIHRQEKLNELIQYRSEYHQSFQDKAVQGLHGRQINDYHSFLSGLELAIKKQRQQIQQTEVICEQMKQQYLVRHKDTRVMDKVVERFRGDEQLQQRRDEQKETDEHALNMFRHKRHQYD